MSTCSNPGCKITTDLKKCSCCLSVTYCGQQCQRQHWKKHKPSCKPPPNVVEPASPPTQPPNVVEPLDTASAVEEVAKSLFENVPVSNNEMSAILHVTRLKPPTWAESADVAKIVPHLSEMLQSNSASANAIKEECRVLARIADLTVNGIVKGTKPLSFFDILELAKFAGMLK